MSSFWLHILVWLVGALQPEVPESSPWSTLRTRAPDGEPAAAFHPSPWQHQMLESSVLLVHNQKLRIIQKEMMMLKNTKSSVNMMETYFGPQETGGLHWTQRGSG